MPNAQHAGEHCRKACADKEAMPRRDGRIKSAVDARFSGKGNLQHHAKRGQHRRGRNQR
jgi:hypothetical protein